MSTPAPKFPKHTSAALLAASEVKQTCSVIRKLSFGPVTKSLNPKAPNPKPYTKYQTHPPVALETQSTLPMPTSTVATGCLTCVSNYGVRGVPSLSVPRGARGFTLTHQNLLFGRVFLNFIGFIIRTYKNVGFGRLR